MLEMEMAGRRYISYMTFSLNYMNTLHRAPNVPGRKILWKKTEAIFRKLRMSSALELRAKWKKCKQRKLRKQSSYSNGTKYSHGNI